MKKAGPINLRSCQIHHHQIIGSSNHQIIKSSNHQIILSALKIQLEKNNLTFAPQK